MVSAVDFTGMADVPVEDRATLLSNNGAQYIFRQFSGYLKLVGVKHIAAFVGYYNYRRYHEGLSDVTPCHVYTSEHLEIIQRRKEAKSRTLHVRRDYNRVVREQGNDL